MMKAHARRGRAQLESTMARRATSTPLSRFTSTPGRGMNPRRSRHDEYHFWNLRSRSQRRRTRHWLAVGHHDKGVNRANFVSFGSWMRQISRGAFIICRSGAAWRTRRSERYALAIV